jgi:hypothetical protein
MCWEPLKTHMEKNQMFPLSKEKLKSMRFFRNHAKKKSLIGQEVVSLSDNFLLVRFLLESSHT